MAELESVTKTDEGNGSGLSPAVSEGDVNLNKSRDPIVVEVQQHKRKGIERTPCDCQSVSLIVGIVLVALVTISVIAVILIYLDDSSSPEVSGIEVGGTTLPDTAHDQP
ncbi:uncharacterized protein [Amphiura filiformis]|uniref:uncharacterized protein n=1 Tax=Amphiura filiformis TaxID=82378 RepID=UPI003B227775